MRKGPENTKPIFSRSDHTEAKQYILIDQELRAQISNPKSQLWEKGGLENKEYVYPATPAPQPKGRTGQNISLRAHFLLASPQGSHPDVETSLEGLSFGFICIHLHTHPRMHSSFLGNFQVNMIIATFRLSWIDFTLLTFLLICSQSPSLDTGWLCTGVVGRAVLTGGEDHPAPAWWQREGQQGQLQQPLLSPCPQDKLREAAQSHLLCSD